MESILDVVVVTLSVVREAVEPDVSDISVDNCGPVFEEAESCSVVVALGVVVLPRVVSEINVEKVWVFMDVECSLEDVATL